MLVLNRCVGQKIYLGDDITVKVLEINRGRVTLGVVAPPEVPVRRLELQQLAEAEDAKRKTKASE